MLDDADDFVVLLEDDTDLEDLTDATADQRFCAYQAPMTIDPLDEVQTLRENALGSVLSASDASAALKRAGVRHALVGDHALAVHGHVRATRDVDFVVDGHDKAARAVAGLNPSWLVAPESSEYHSRVHDARGVTVAEFTDYRKRPIYRAMLDCSKPAGKGKIPVADVHEIVAGKYIAAHDMARPPEKRAQDRVDAMIMVRKHSKLDVERIVHSATAGCLPHEAAVIETRYRVDHERMRAGRLIHDGDAVAFRFGQEIKARRSASRRTPRPLRPR